MNEFQSIVKDALLVTLAIALVGTVYFYSKRDGGLDMAIPTSMPVTTSSPETNQVPQFQKPYEMTKELKTFVSYDGKFAIDIPIDWAVERNLPNTSALSNLTLEDIKGEPTPDRRSFGFYSPEKRVLEWYCSLSQDNCDYTVRPIADIIIHASPNRPLNYKPQMNVQIGSLSWQRSVMTENYGSDSIDLWHTDDTSNYFISVSTEDEQALLPYLSTFRKIDFASYAVE